jgi:hypothetical protein
LKRFIRRYQNIECGIFSRLQERAILERSKSCMHGRKRFMMREMRAELVG